MLASSVGCGRASSSCAVRATCWQQVRLLSCNQYRNQATGHICFYQARCLIVLPLIHTLLMVAAALVAACRRLFQVHRARQKQQQQKQQLLLQAIPYI
jgi:hypothetical protein